MLNIAEVLNKNTLEEHHGFLDGPSGHIEAIITSNIMSSKDRVGIICHPHPLYQGTMRNKVVTSVAKALHKQGMPTIRFNYRGVGGSAGSYDHACGEIDDALAIVDQILYFYPKIRLWIAGFSFGAYIAAQVAAKHTMAADQLITIAPAVNKVDFTSIAGVTCPWLTIIGEDDEIVPYDDVVAWHDSLHANKKLINIAACSHFFHGKLPELMQVIPICK